MRHHRNPPATPDATESTASDERRIFVRPDGYFWIADNSRQEFGPFDSAAAALADMRDEAALARRQR